VVKIFVLINTAKENFLFYECGYEKFLSMNSSTTNVLVHELAMENFFTMNAATEKLGLRTAALNIRLTTLNYGLCLLFLKQANQKKCVYGAVSCQATRRQTALPQD
jgi:hypothetical protein